MDHREELVSECPYILVGTYPATLLRGPGRNEDKHLIYHRAFDMENSFQLKHKCDLHFHSTAMSSRICLAGGYIINDILLKLINK